MVTQIFRPYWHVGVREVIPILPWNAEIDRSHGSTVSDTQRGKIPGKYKPAKNKWVGFDGWTDFEINEAAISVWDSWPNPNVGLRAKFYPAIDFDAESTELADGLIELATQFLGKRPPVRGRAGSARILMPFKLLDGERPIGKHRIVFIHPDVPNSPGVSDAAVEFLGAGQQYLIQGIHPSGKPYEWYDDRDILMWHLLDDTLIEVTAAQWVRWIAVVMDWLQKRGATITAARGYTAHDGDDKPIGDKSLLARDMKRFQEALEAIPCKDLLYEDWIEVLRAAKAGSGGDEEFFANVVLKWCECEEYPKNTDEVVRQKWDSFHTSIIGADWLYGKAREHGWEGTPEAFDRMDDEGEGGKQESPQSEARPNGHIPEFATLPTNFDAAKLKMFPWVLGGTAMKGAVTAIYGQSSASKSTFALLRAVAIASGRDLTGEEVHERGHVLFYNGEDSTDVILKRIGAILKHYEIPLDEIRPYLHFASGQDHRLIMARKLDNNIGPTSAVSELVEEVRRIGAVHVCVDPLVNLHRGLSENSNDEMEELITTLRTVAQKGHCSVDVVHHTSKQRSNSAAADMNAARGASSIISAVRTGLMVVALDPEEVTKRKLAGRIVEIRMAKANYAPLSDKPWLFRVLSICIGNGPDGSAEFPSDDKFVQPLGDRIGVLELIPPSEVGEARAAADEAKREKVLDAVIKVMGDKHTVRQKEILNPLQAALKVGKTKMNETLDKYLPLGRPQRVTVGQVTRELTRRKVPPGHDRSPIEIMSRVIQAEAA